MRDYPDLQLFFSGSDKPVPNYYLPEKYQQFPAHKKLYVIDSKDFEKGISVPSIFTRVPRSRAVQLSGAEVSFLSVQRKFNAMVDLSKCKSKSHRGKSKTAALEDESGTSYQCVGEAPKRGGKGTYQRLPNDLPNSSFQEISKVVNIMEQAAFEFLDNKTLRMLSAVREVSDMNGMPMAKEGKYSTLFSSLAAAVNCFLNVHIDEDAGWSINTIISGKEEDYGMNAAIKNYWCFPELGIAVAMRAGDIILFNPLVYHCISSRCDESVDVVNATLYLKTAVVAGNNNDPEKHDEFLKRIELLKGKHGLANLVL